MLCSRWPCQSLATHSGYQTRSPRKDCRRRVLRHDDTCHWITKTAPEGGAVVFARSVRILRHSTRPASPYRGVWATNSRSGLEVRARTEFRDEVPRVKVCELISPFPQKCGAPVLRTRRQVWRLELEKIRMCPAKVASRTCPISSIACCTPAASPDLSASSNWDHSTG